ncbi:RecF/RecN/SMC [Lipomyces oligophaga]|uniref:RecF/RecN/SMC n=1 Tax=Lipomyces oligophaga TaxID=45792 RepID=UPI0034CE38F2
MVSRRSTRSTRSSVVDENSPAPAIAPRTRRAPKSSLSSTTNSRSRRANRSVEPAEQDDFSDASTMISVDQSPSITFSTPINGSPTRDIVSSPLAVDSLMSSPSRVVQNSLRKLTLKSPSILLDKELQSTSVLSPMKATNTPKPSPLTEISPSRQNTTIVAELVPVKQAPKMEIPEIGTVTAENHIGSEGSVKRLIISNLVLNNFKSYAGRQVVGPFHSSFSAVVGPNGSGKSNVIDSLLFVFGFRASKMRQAKVSALIHNSAAHPDLNQCSVEVHFQDVIDNPDGSTTVVPDSQLVVARRAYKNNTSKYTINDRESNYNEVTSLLRSRGIDLDHKRFLILQGEVESIAQMKPKAQNENDDGLLEYLEDIIGTANYKKLIDESAQELETLNEVCHEKLGRLDIVRKEKENLESSRSAALNFLKETNELRMKQSALYQFYAAASQEKIAVIEKVLTSLQTELHEQKTNNSGNEEEIRALNDTYKQAAKEIERLQADAKNSAKALAKHERDVVQLTERKKHIAIKQEKLAKTISTSAFSVNNSSGWSSTYDEEIAKLNTEIGQLQASLTEEESKLEDIKESLEGKTKGISEEIEQKKKLLGPWNDKINMKISELDVTKSQIDIILSKREADRKAVEEQREKIRAVKANGRAKEKTIDELTQRLSHVNDQIKIGDSEVSQALTELDKMREKTSIIRLKALESREEYDAEQSQGSVLTSLKRLEDTGRINGFFGRLGNLGAIDGQFDVAISTACPSLNNLVVGSVDTGQACIEYLRKNNLGRAKFILLDKLPKRDLTPIRTPENVPRLFDLVRPKEEQFAQAFYSVMFDTLVARDMAQANRIAYGKKRWRVVTLDGKLIDTAGTMSGGGSKVSKGLMRSKLAEVISDKQLKKIEDEYARAEEELEAAASRVNSMEDALRDLKKSKPELEMSISKIDLEIEALGTHLLDAKKMQSELQAELETNLSDDAEIQQLEARVSELDAELGELRAKTSSIEGDINDLEENIMKIGGVKLRIQKSKVDGIKEQIDLRSEQVNSNEISKAKSEKDALKKRKVIEEAENELKIIEEEFKNADEELANAQRSASGMEEVSRKATFALEEKQDSLLEIKEELDSRSKYINEFRKAELELSNKIESQQKELKESKSRLKHWREKQNSLSLFEVEEEEGGVGEDPEGEEKGRLELQQYSTDELEAIDVDVLKAEIADLEESTDKAQVDLTVLEEYKRREKEYATRHTDLNESVGRRDSVKLRYEELRKRRLDEFMAGFSEISIKLKEMYQMITMGGNAELELVDSLDPFSEGILFSVMPPKKSWKNISNLSGGEKTLSSLALVFALHHFKPTPLYVMDEIDAALDFRNVSIVANYIKERTKNAQFIVISLRNNMFELAKQLVGIYKVNHMTKSITMQNRELTNVISEGRHRD